jgi:hypothetical protein
MNVGGCLKVLAFLAVLTVMVVFPPLGLLLMFIGFTTYFYNSRKG